MPITWDDEKPKEKGGIVWDDEPAKVATPEGAGASIESGLRDIPRQLGLTARHIAEGVGDTADLVASPVRASLNALGANIQGRSGKSLADLLNLPEPQNATERVVGDILRLAAGSAGVMGIAGKAAQATTGMTQAVLKAMANRPDLQLASSIGAGGAGGAVRETGGGPLSQAVAALAGGVAAPLALSGGQKAASAIQDFASRRSPDLSARIDAVINEAIRPSGMSAADISDSVRKSLRDDIQKAMKSGELTPEVVRRLADYRMTGLTPTAGPLTLDPGIVTRQKNLSALGANSQDPKLQALSQIENTNARKLIENINSMGADTADDALSAGAKVAGALSAKEQAAKTKIGGLYDQARDSTGRSAMLDGKAFARQTQAALKENLSDDFLPAGIKSRLEAIGKGEETLTVDMAEKIKTAIGKLQRNSSDGNVRYALGIVRENLDNTPLISSGTKSALDESMIAKHISGEPAAVWGLRIVDKKPEIGSTLKQSGDWTGEGAKQGYLPGTSTIGIQRGKILEALDILEKGKYHGKHVILVKGDSAGFGSDVGERLIKNAEVVDIFDISAPSRGQGAIEAFGKARSANREWMKTVEETPALQAIRDGVEPDKFVQTYITGKGNAASVNAVAKLRDQIKDVPEAMTAVKNNIAQTLKNSALSGKADELARFSSTSYNKALNSIGDAKLSMFYTPKEIQALKAIGRVASYEQFQPTGSAVNNSKTAAAVVANLLDRIGGNPVINKLTLGTSAPVARIVSGPLREASASAEAGRLAGLPISLAHKKPSDPVFMLPPVLAPWMLDQ